MKWARGAFRTLHLSGWVDRTGWVRGVFGIDRRPEGSLWWQGTYWARPWHITHIPTGFRLTVARTRPIANEVVAEIETMGDWSTVTTKAPASVRAALLRRRDAGEVWISPSQMEKWTEPLP